MMKNLQQLTRPNIWSLKPYSSARDEYKGVTASVFLDANENPYNSPNNRYPDPLQSELKNELARLKNVQPQQIFLGNGSDEAIDLMFRVFCEPERDNVVAIDPTYGMYQVAADINNVGYRKVLLNDEYQCTAEELLAATDQHTKLIFLCSPNNPTGNELAHSEVMKVIGKFDGLVVLDEAYNDFSEAPSMLEQLNAYPNLIILQTFSKAWGSAGIRLGIAYAEPEIIALLNKVKYPYNVNRLTQLEGLDMIRKHSEIEHWVKMLIEERNAFMNKIKQLDNVEKVFPSDANFFLVRMAEGTAVSTYHYLVSLGIIVRNRHSISLCGNCLRITVGTPDENNALLDALKSYTDTQK